MKYSKLVISFSKTSLLITFRLKPLKMATEFFRSAILKINEEQTLDALALLQKAEYQATEGLYLSPCFKTLLKCVKIKMSCGALIESAVEIQGEINVQV